MELINALGLDFKILIVQLLNFAILFFILNKFGFQPMLKFLEERNQKISKGVQNANLAEKRLIEISEKEKAVLSNAKKEAKKIMEEVKKDAEKKKQEIIDSAKNEVGLVINTEKEKIQQEKAEVLKELRTEVSGLVMMSLEKILEEKIDDKKDKILIENQIKKISSNS
jgi:F-type H+-transporting ATPase subunit b